MKKIVLLTLFLMLSAVSFAGADITLSGVINPVTIAPQMRLDDNGFNSNFQNEDINLYIVEDVRNGELVISYIMF